MIGGGKRWQVRVSEHSCGNWWQVGLGGGKWEKSGDNRQ